ncbi:MFS transporter [Spirosoma migulaei]
MDPKTVATFGAVISLPWGFKFLWGPVLDRFQQSNMGRRRPWILLAQFAVFGVSVAMLFVKDPLAEFNTLIIVFTLQSVFMSLQDVSVDATAIAVVPPVERGRLNAFMKAGASSGQAIGAAGLAYLLHYSGFQIAVLAQTIIFLIVIILVFFTKENSKDASISFKYGVHKVAIKDRSFISLISDLWRATTSTQSLLIFTAVSIIYFSIRVFKQTYSLHLIQKLGWSDVSMSVLSGTYSTLISVLLALVGGVILDRLGNKRMLLLICVIMGVFYITFSVIGDLWVNTAVATTGVVIQQTLEVIYIIVALSVVMGLCKRGIEAAQFAVYMALINQIDSLGMYVAGNLFTQISAPALGILSGLIMLSALLLITAAFRNSRSLQTNE